MANVYKINAAGGLRIPVLTADPGSPENGLMWYNSTDGVFRKRENGSTVTLAGSEFADDTFRIVDDGDATKKIAFQASGITTSTTRTITMPDSDVDLGTLNSHLDGGTSKHDATEVDYERSDGSKVDIQAASDDVETALTDLDDNKISKTGSIAFTGNQSMGGNKITNLGTPTSDTDAATKAYVDATASGLDLKASVRAATTAALAAVTYDNGTSGVGATLTADANGALAAQDGVTLVASDRFLVKNQASALQNGLYEVTAVGDGSNPFILTRVTDADQAAEVTGGMFTFVEEGTTQADSGWVLTTDGAITMGTTGLDFTQFSGAGQITAGAGLTKTANTLDVGAGNGIAVAADSVAVQRDATGGANLATAIDVNSNGVAVRVDDSTIEEGISGQLRVKDAGITDAKVATGIDAVKLADGSVSNTEFQFLDGVTSSIQTQLTAKLENIVEDTTPQLGGTLDTNDQVVQHTANGLRIGTSATDFYEHDYVHAAVLSGSTTAVASPFTFAHASFEALTMEYKMKDGTTGVVRVGTIMVATDGTNAEITDAFTESGGDIGVTWTAAVNGANVELTYTTANANTVTMRAATKRIKA